MKAHSLAKAKEGPKHQNSDFEPLVAAGGSGTPPNDSNVFAGVFDIMMYSELICVPAALCAVEIQKIFRIFSCGTPNSMYVSA